MTPPNYPPEILSPDYDDGTMPRSRDALAEALIGRRIVSAEKTQVESWPGSSYTETATVLTLDDGTKVEMVPQGDCCAYTEMEEFLLDPSSVDHMILGVGTTDEFQTWHIFADFGDVMKLKVGWSGGNVGWYTYGFDIRVRNEETT